MQRQPEKEEEEETLQTKPIADQITPLVQRQEEPPEEEEEEIQAKFKDGEVRQHVCPEREEGTAQRQPDEYEDEELQTKSKPGESPAVTIGLEFRINSMKGGGQPLPKSERSYFEPRFGLDFSQVRVHTDAQASEMAKSINAQAFTVGQDVVFRAGKYVPDTLQGREGRRLLGHELTHVVQQTGRQLPRAKPQASWEAIPAPTSLEADVGMKAGSEIPSEGIGASAVSLKEPVRRGMGPAALAPQRVDVQGNLETVRLNFLYFQRQFEDENENLQTKRLTSSITCPS